MGRPRTNEAAVALFPFLAVLLCTMGSLILMLVVITRNQADRARKEAAAPQPVAAVDTTERDELDWEIEQLSKSRDKTAEQLADRRAALSHLEEHAQRLRNELAELEAAERLFFDRKTLDEAAKDALRAELQELLKKIAETEAKLAAAKAQGKRPPNFAIIPYDGEHGTRRRPIYIECRADAIVLHPEGTTFSEGDFIGSLGPSNPLATCLRVVAEHHARTGAMQAGEQPYPLLLVRPSGIATYYVAMAALRSWDSEFGYELIDENWPLEFPPADPQLAQTLARAQDAARRRQQMIARATPNSDQGPRPSFRDLAGDDEPMSSASGGSGGTSSGGPASGGSGRRYMRPNDTPMAQSPAAASGYGAVGNGPGGNGYGGYGSQGMNAPGGANLAGTNSQGVPSLPGTTAPAGTTPLVAGLAPNSATATNAAAASGGMPGVPMQTGDGSSIAPVGSIAGGSTPGGTMPNGSDPNGATGPSFGTPDASGSGTSGNGGSPGVAATVADSGNGSNGNTASGGTPSMVGPRYEQNAPGGYPSTGDAAYSGNAASSGTAAPGNSASTGSNPAASGNSASGNSASGGTPFAGTSAGGTPGDASGGASGGSPSMSAMAGGDPTPPQPQLPGNFQDQPPANMRSLAADRGRNWGLPEHARRATGITRPVQIYCSRDRLTVLSDRGTPDKQIDMQGPTQEVVDELVSTVWGQVEDWGIAGRGMFWKPTLAMHVAPDGVDRYRELQALLADSGLDVTGKAITVSSKASQSSRRGY